MNDTQLLELLDAGPADRMTMLKSLYGEPVRPAAAQQLSCAKDVQSCFRDTFADFYAQRKRFDPSIGSLRGYLITISTRKAIRVGGSRRVNHSVPGVMFRKNRKVTREVLLCSSDFSSGLRC